MSYKEEEEKASSKEKVAEKPDTFLLLPKIINGGIAAIIGVSCVFPMDLVKTRLQNQQIGPNGEKMYKNIFDCFRKTYRAEGYFGMYRGAAVNILLVSPEKTSKLAANDYFCYKFTSADGTLTLPYRVLAGAIAGVFQITITTPMELLKIQMQDAGRVAAQSQLEGKTVSNVTARQVIKDRGITTLYRGFGATALRDIPFSMIFFPLYSGLTTFGPRKSDGSGEPVFWVSTLAGLACGSSCALAVTPFDVVKTRLQALKKAKGEREFTGIVDCFTKTLKYEGVRALFKGGLCRVSVIAPLYGIIQTVYYLGVAERLLGLK